MWVIRNSPEKTRVENLAYYILAHTNRSEKRDNVSPSWAAGFAPNEVRSPWLVHDTAEPWFRWRWDENVRVIVPAAAAGSVKNWRIICACGGVGGVRTVPVSPLAPAHHVGGGTIARTFFQTEAKQL